MERPLKAWTSSRQGLALAFAGPKQCSCTVSSLPGPLLDSSLRHMPAQAASRLSGWSLRKLLPQGQPFERPQTACTQLPGHNPMTFGSWRLVTSSTEVVSQRLDKYCMGAHPCFLPCSLGQHSAALWRQQQTCCMTLIKMYWEGPAGNESRTASQGQDPVTEIEDQALPARVQTWQSVSHPSCKQLSWRSATRFPPASEDSSRFCGTLSFLLHGCG